MVTTVTFNPAIDKTLILDSFEIGKVNRLKSSREDVGGKGINVSKVINLLKGETIATGFLGSHNKGVFENHFTNTGLKNDFVYVNDNTRVNTKIISLKDSLTTDLNEIGFFVNEDNITELKKKIINHAKKSQYTVFSGSFPRNLKLSNYIDYINSVKQNTNVIIDADGEVLKEGIKTSPYLIKPNENELRDTVGINVTNIEEVIKGTLNIIQTYKVKWVLVSRGKDGSILISKDKIYLAKPIKVKVISSVGAGDSMLGGLIYALEQGKSMIEALKYATACGTLAVTKEGTELIEHQEVIKLISKVIIEDITSSYIE